MDVAETMADLIRNLRDEYIATGVFTMPTNWWRRPDGSNTSYTIPPQSIVAMMRVLAGELKRPFIYRNGSTLTVPNTKQCSPIWIPFTLAGEELFSRWGQTPSDKPIKFQRYTKHFQFYFKNLELYHDVMRSVLSDPDHRKRLKIPC